jgi:two-component system NtrC family sensor kinase
LDACGIAWLKPDMRTEVSRWLAEAQPSHRSADIPYVKDQKNRLLGFNFRRIIQNGRTMGFVVTGADVTEVRALEFELRQAQRLEAVGQLAAGIAHEMNTPIQYVSDNLRFLQEAFQTRQTALLSYERVRRAAQAGEPLEGLLAELAKVLDEADLEYLSSEVPKAFTQSLDGVERVATIVRAMKEFAHPGRKEKAAADLNRALSNALIVARNEIKYVADVETDFGELPPVLCHLAEMNQVFLNLLINAAHAIREVVQKTERKGRITVRTRREGNHAVIAISDTGCGIPASIQSKVFDPFFTTKPVGQGTGQGLSIARSIVVEKHGGTLTFEPNGAQGTTFLVALPLDAAPDQGAIPPDPSRSMG